VEALSYLERPAAGDADGLLVLHHGRGSDERDLLGLADVLDPGQRLHVVTPRGPLELPGWPGYHWYEVPQIGHPDVESYHHAFGALAAFHDLLWERTGIGPERTVLGGFSMGAVMSYGLGLASLRPVPAGIMAFSGFVPTTIESRKPDLPSRSQLPVFIAHGTHDPIIGIQFAHKARHLLEHGGLPVTYLESEAGHEIDPAHLPAAQAWLDARW